MRVFTGAKTTVVVRAPPWPCATSVHALPSLDTSTRYVRGDVAASGAPERPPPAVWRTIIGIVRTVRHTGLQDSGSLSVAYVPVRQDPPGFATVMIRSAVSPEIVMTAVRKEVQAI